MNTAVEYKAFKETFPPSKDQTEEQQETLEQALKALSNEEQHKYHRMCVEAYFIPENRSPNSAEFLSPSGNYRIVKTNYGTRPGSWSYTLGEVFQGKNLITSVMRNYSSMDHTWIEDHPSGHDLLVTGEDYQGQTVIELDTGRRRDFLPEAAKKGFGFCWTGAVPSPDKTLLIVDGCIWAGPYEYRVYDFSNPIENGWPELESPIYFNYEDNSSLTVEEDLIVYLENERFFKETGETASELESARHKLYVKEAEAKNKGDAEEMDKATKAKEDHWLQYPDEEEDADKWGLSPIHKVILKRDGLDLITVSEWKSDSLLKREASYAAYVAKQQEDMRRWRAEDPLYQWFAQQEPDAEKLRKRTSFSYPSGDMRAKGDKNPAYFRVSCQDYVEGQKRSATVEWGITEGSLVLDLWQYRKGSIAKHTFERSVSGLQEAMHIAKEHTS